MFVLKINRLENRSELEICRVKDIMLTFSILTKVRKLQAQQSAVFAILFLKKETQSKHRVWALTSVCPFGPCNQNQLISVMNHSMQHGLASCQCLDYFLNTNKLWHSSLGRGLKVQPQLENVLMQIMHCKGHKAWVLIQCKCKCMFYNCIICASTQNTHNCTEM